MTNISSAYFMRLNDFIHKNNELYEYHMNHIKLVAEYAKVLHRKLGEPYSWSFVNLVETIALTHDLFKERSLNPETTVTFEGVDIPQDLNRYVRLNLDILDKYNIGQYFNTDIQLHALAAGIFLVKQCNIEDPEILYPVFFHSCPIISVYETLPSRTQSLVDIIMLADKLSSNYLRINMRKVPVRIDLDLAVFGPTGKEFNYTMGLFLAKIIGSGKSKEAQSVIANMHYYKRLLEMNSFIPKSYSIGRIGGSKEWPVRNSPVLPTAYHYSET